MSCLYAGTCGTVPGEFNQASEVRRVVRNRTFIFTSDQKVKKKAIEIEIAFANSLGNPKGRTLDHFFYA